MVGYSQTPSKNLRKFGQQQMSVAVMCLCVGLVYSVGAAISDTPVMSGDIYGRVTSVKAEVWSWPLLLGSMTYITGLLMNGNWRWSSLLRLFGSINNTVLPATFVALSAGIAPLNPFVVAASVVGGFNLWFVVLNVGDSYRAITLGKLWKKS